MSASEATLVAAPPVVPRPLCAAYAPLLRLLRSHSLEPDERGAVESHLADCAWCQRQLATYDVVDEALRRHYTAGSLPLAEGGDARGRERAKSSKRGAEASASVVSAEREDGEWAEGNLWSRGGSPTNAPGAPESYSSLTPLSRVAFVLVLGALALALFARLGSLGPTVPAVQTASSRHVAAQGAPLTSSLPSAPLPALDGQAAAYVDLLHTYYEPLYAQLAASHNCEDAYADAAPDAQLAALLGCRDAEVAVVSAAQTLARHLATATPPARWQDAHQALTQAVQQTVTEYQQRVAAIDAHNATAFDLAALTDGRVLTRYCEPLVELNAELADGQLLDTPTPLCFAPVTGHSQPR